MKEDSSFSFPSADFRETVAGIIASPRRTNAGNAHDYDSLFVITAKQRSYYEKCFKHLLKSTKNSTSIDLTLNGNDFQVVDFFRRSGLSNENLSRIWTLSDVNEDGFLSFEEFCIAMHLIVLRVKGEVPIPSSLPDWLKPAKNTSNSIGVGSQENTARPHSSTVQHATSSNSVDLSSWDPFPAPTTSNSCDMEKNSLPIAEFSDTPPLLVDSRPTAVKATSAIISLKSPSGPPPQPPPRLIPRGHGRSASLDLKTFQPGLALFDRRDSDSSAVTSSMSAGPIPQLGNRPNLNAASTSVPPPIPARNSPPVANGPSRPDRSAATQTDEVEVLSKNELDSLISSIGAQTEDLLFGEDESSNGKGIDRWIRRCKALQSQNSELELERARLAQVRIQLELRLQELEERVQTKASTNKPTSL